MASKLDEPQGRGAFFRSLGTLFAGFVAERIEEAVTRVGPELLRPPGALDELAFLTACTRCDKCAKACPQGSILNATPAAGLSAGTPFILPRSRPCYLCEDLPCIPACPEGALVPPLRTVAGEERTGPAAVRMGTAQVKSGRCLTYPSEQRAAEECRICVDRCPFPGEAIRLGEPENGQPPHPVVEVDRCTGCGLCVFACPAEPPAIVVAPRR